MPHRRLVVAAYDISAARRLKRALKLCTEYASGGQKSVHECWVTAGERAALCRGLEKICRADADVWMVADLAKAAPALALGRADPPAPPRPVIFFG